MSHIQLAMNFSHGAPGGVRNVVRLPSRDTTVDANSEEVTTNTFGNFDCDGPGSSRFSLGTDRRNDQCHGHLLCALPEWHNLTKNKTPVAPRSDLNYFTYTRLPKRRSMYSDSVIFC
jgi:hypothetical protein